MKTHTAPWSPLLIVLSALATLLCVGIAGSVFFCKKHGWEEWAFFMPLVLTAGCALFAIRGYTVTPEAILVHRLLWSTRLPREGLTSAEFVPHAMRGSIRTCGNGGFFSFSGFYWSRKWKSYRAYVTDPRRTVVLRYGRRTVIVSPGIPEDFVRELAS